MSTRTWIKMLGAGALVCIGGPWLVIYVTPSEEELVKRYNPELQRRSREGREARQQEFDTFTARLKEYSKSDKPIWDAWNEDVERKRQASITQRIADHRAEQAALEQRRAEIRDSSR